MARRRGRPKQHEGSIWTKKLDTKFSYTLLILLPILAVAAVGSYMAFNWETFEPAVISEAPRIWVPIPEGEPTVTREFSIEPHADLAAMHSYFDQDALIGYISLRGTNISDVVIQGNDNSFYLNHSLWGTSDAEGTIFLDASANLSQNHLVFYGNVAASGRRFADLATLTEQGDFDRASEIRFTTGTGDYRWEPFAFYVIDNSQINTSATLTQDAIDQMVALSMHYSPVTVDTTDRVITLIAETAPGSGTSFVLHGRQFN